MFTALDAGIFWDVKGMIVAYISNIRELEQVKLAVQPDFQKPIFFSKINCILKMRIVHIITIAIYILVWKVRWWVNGYTAKSSEQPAH